MPTPGFHLSAVPPATLLALGQAFSTPDPEPLDQAGHYDNALYHLMTYWSGVERDENGVSHLAMTLKHVAHLMGHSVPTLPPQVHNPTMQAALNQGATFNANSQPQASQLSEPGVNATPDPQTEPQAETPPEEPKKRPRMTADGFVILEFQPGITLTTDQARERAGVGKSQMARLLQDGKFVRAAGVIESAATGRFNKVYLAEELDAWKLKRAKPPRKEMSEEAKATLRQNIGKARAANADLETVEWTHVENGQWWTYETVADYVKLSRGWLNNAIKEGKFPKPRAKARKPGTAGTGSSLFWPQDIIDWVNKSGDASYARAARREADNNPQRPRTAVDGSEPEPEPVAPAVVEAVALVAEPPAEIIQKLSTWGTVKVNQPNGWMNLREVAAYLGTTETSVERMVRDNKFPQAHKRNTRLGIREWGARQVAKWKRENVEVGALVK